MGAVSDLLGYQQNYARIYICCQVSEANGIGRPRSGCLTTTAFYCGLGIPLAIRKNIGYAVPEGQPLYNFREYNGYTMGIAGKKD